MVPKIKLPNCLEEGVTNTCMARKHLAAIKPTQHLNVFSNSLHRQTRTSHGGRSLKATNVHIRG